jgi:hypothetical protein
MPRCNWLMDGEMHKCCEHCGAIFTPKSSKGSTLAYFKKRRFCSASCAAKATANRIPVAERFLRNLPRPRADDACWEWVGARHATGYGALNVDGVVRTAHRLSWEHFNGPIPVGAHVLHRCDNPPCCNPAHLFLGDAKANSADKHAKNRANVQRGEKSGKAKLTEADVLRIRRCTTPAAILAAELGVTPQSIGAVRLRRHWRHVA